MRSIIIILFMLCYSVGNILLPDIGISEMHTMYKQCAAEDPDIDLPDFLFEHLLHLTDYFEHDKDEHEEENEKPHQPFHISATAYNIAINIQEPIHFQCRSVIIYSTPGKPTSLYHVHMPQGCFSNVFRPPAA